MKSKTILTLLTLAPLLCAGNLIALEPFYLDSDPGAPYPWNPCPTCGTSMNADGSTQVHDSPPESATSFSAFESYSAAESPFPDKGVCKLVFTANLQAVDPAQLCLTTNGYTNHVFQFWYQTTPGPVWDSTTNFFLTFPVYDNVFTSSGGTLKMDHLFPAKVCKSVIHIDVFCTFPDGVQKTDSGYFTLCPPGYTAQNFDFEVQVNGLEKDYLIFSSSPQFPTDKRPLCNPSTQIQKSGPNAADIYVGGYTPDYDYSVMRAEDLSAPVWTLNTNDLDGLLSTDEAGYGSTTVSTSGAQGFFKVVP